MAFNIFWHRTYRIEFFEHFVIGGRLGAVHQVTNQVFNIKLADLNRMDSLAIPATDQLCFDIINELSVLEKYICFTLREIHRMKRFCKNL